MANWQPAVKATEEAAECLLAANQVDDELAPPTAAEQAELTVLILQIERELDALRRRAGISTILPARVAPDFGTRLGQASRSLRATVDALNNYNPNAQPHGAALGLSRTAVQRISDAVDYIRRAEVAHLGR